MKPGVRRTIRLNLRRKVSKSAHTKLIVKAIGDGAYIRHEVKIQMPGQQPIVFLADGPAGSWSASEDGIALNPRPNQATEWIFQLANQSRESVRANARLFSLNGHRHIAIAQGMLTEESADDILEKLGPMQLLADMPNIELPAGGTRVSLPFPVPTLEENEENESGDAPPKETKTDDKPKVSVRHGLILVATDEKSGRSAIRRLTFKPQRPRRYVQATAGYDVNRQRLQIQVSAVNPSRIPPTGIKVHCGFAEPLPDGTEAQLDDVIRPTRPEVNLYAVMPMELNATVTAFLDVDGYPRAFAWRIPCYRPSSRLPPIADMMDVRILHPKSGTAFPAPAATVPVQLQVDAPAGAFESEADWIEAGIDIDRDREFRDESTLRLYADRQADVLLRGFGESGRISFDAQVGDFELQIPGAAIQNVRVNLLARLSVGRRSVWSEPVEILLDQAGPKVERIQLRPDRTVLAGDDLEVIVQTADHAMSGVAKVEVGFDVARSGQFDESLPPVEAVAGEGSTWVAMLPTGDVAPGTYTILVLASDEVGNTSEFGKVKIRILTPEQAEALTKAAVNRISGNVYYGKDPLPKADVWLEDEDGEQIGSVKTNSRGYFEITEVPPGKYRLKARGLARNRPRTAEREIEIKPPPAKFSRLRIEVK